MSFRAEFRNPNSTDGEIAVRRTSETGFLPPPSRGEALRRSVYSALNTVLLGILNQRLGLGIVAHAVAKLYQLFHD